MKALLLICTACLYALTMYAQPGSVDLSFGNHGKIIQSNSLGSALTFDRIAIQSNGKIIAGSSQPLDDGSLAVYRYKANGKIDPGFGTNSRLQFNAVSYGSPDFINKIIIQPDDKILVAGQTFSFPQGAFVTRFTSNGKIDSSFGINGAVIYHQTNLSLVSDVLLQSDGKILLSGVQINNGNPPTISYLLLRYNVNGTADISFGTNGMLYTPVAYQTLAQQSDGKIVTGFVNFGEYRFYFKRILLNGSADASFGNNGQCFIDANLGNGLNVNFNHINNISLQPSGKIVFTGYVSGSTKKNNDFTSFAVGRITMDGHVDSSFYKTGLVPYYINPNSTAYAVKAAIQPDNKIIVGSYTLTGNKDTSVLIRLNDNGSPDKSFGVQGFVPEFASLGFGISDIALAPDGKIVTGGSAGISGACLARYNGYNTAAIAAKAYPLNNILPGTGNVLVYPNPSHSFISLTGFNKTKSECRLVIAGLNGEILLSAMTTNDTYTLNIQNLSAGSYFIKVFISGKAVQELKFIKQ